MNRLTTDKPFDFLDVICNMVYPVDGWAHIRTGMDEDMPITDFCLKLCKLNNCLTTECSFLSEEDKDDLLCSCASEGCPVAHVYAALSGYSHLRDRLKMYEDAGMMPPKWISVKDRMPEIHQSVIVHVRHTHSPDDGWHVVESDVWCGDGWDVNADSDMHEVTHWMPLPNPPKEEAHENA